MTGMYTAIQNRLIEEHHVTLCDGMKGNSSCPYRSYPSPHRCVYHKGSRYRRIGNWRQEDTLESTFILLHEIGHLQKHYSYKVEDEYRAGEWALRQCVRLHLQPERGMISSCQLRLMRLYDKQSEEFRDFDLYGIEKPEWFKDREYYSITRLYDELFPDRGSAGCTVTPLFPTEEE